MTVRFDEDRTAAELSLITLVPIDEDTLALVAPSVLRAAAELAPSAAPAGLLFDLAYLMVGPTARLDLATIRATTGLPTEDRALCSAVVSAFDALIAPIAISSALVEIRDALARHQRDVALDTAGVLTAEIAARVLGEGPPDEAPRLADIRRAFNRPSAEILNKGARALATSARREALTNAYGAVARSARRTNSPLEPADVVVAEGAPHLRHRAARLALRQLTSAHVTIAKRLPAAIPHRRSRGADTSTREHDDSTYPMGGFSSMTNVGSLENVVTSELALSTDGDIGDDLFAIRWAMGELLYYTRDESVAHRRRVSLWIVVPSELAAAGRVKDLRAPFQRIVLALSAVTVFVERAIGILRQEALTIHVVIPAGAGLEEERTLLKIRLADGIERGVVDLCDHGPSEVNRLSNEESKTADVLVVEFRVDTSKSPDTAGKDVLVVVVGERPTLHGQSETPRDDPASSRNPLLLDEAPMSERARDSVHCWSEVVRGLLVAMP